MGLGPTLCPAQPHIQPGLGDTSGRVLDPHQARSPHQAGSHGRHMARMHACIYASTDTGMCVGDRPVGLEVGVMAVLAAAKGAHSIWYLFWHVHTRMSKKKSRCVQKCVGRCSWRQCTACLVFCDWLKRHQITCGLLAEFCCRPIAGSGWSDKAVPAPGSKFPRVWSLYGLGHPRSRISRV